MTSGIILLSMDGGGVRGIMHTEFLKLVLGDIKPNSVFNYYAGSSIGGIVALSMVTTNCVPRNIDFKSAVNKSLFDRILGNFQIFPKYDGKGKRELINRYIEDISVKELPVFIPIYKMSDNSTGMIVDYSYNVNCRELADACSALPTFFPPVRMKVNGISGTFIDGGIVAANPTLIAYTKLRNIYPNRQIKVLSLGCGNVNVNLSKIVSGSLLNWFTVGKKLKNNIAGLLTTQPVDILSSILKDDFIRIDYTLDKISSDDASETYVSYLKDLAHKVYIIEGLKVKRFLNLL
jgi:patatin-like phospholipase/acyl hydrolase